MKQVQKRLIVGSALVGMACAFGYVAVHVARNFGPTHAGFREPKTAPGTDREYLFSLLSAEYESAEAAVDPMSVPGDSYLRRIGQILLNSADRSDWFKYRLIDELGKSHRLFDAGLLLRVSQQLPPGELASLAADTARRVAQQADIEIPSTGPATPNVELEARRR